MPSIAVFSRQVLQINHQPTAILKAIFKPPASTSEMLDIKTNRTPSIIVTSLQQGKQVTTTSDHATTTAL
jgi:hypothetical protein